MFAHPVHTDFWKTVQLTYFSVFASNFFTCLLVLFLFYSFVCKVTLKQSFCIRHLNLILIPLNWYDQQKSNYTEFANSYNDCTWIQLCRHWVTDYAIFHQSHLSNFTNHLQKILSTPTVIICFFCGISQLSQLKMCCTIPGNKENFESCNSLPSVDKLLHSIQQAYDNHWLANIKKTCMQTKLKMRSNCGVKLCKYAQRYHKKINAHLYMYMAAFNTVAIESSNSGFGFFFWWHVLFNNQLFSYETINNIWTRHTVHLNVQDRH